MSNEKLPAPAEQALGESLWHADVACRLEEAVLALEAVKEDWDRAAAEVGGRRRLAGPALAAVVKLLMRVEGKAKYLAITMKAQQKAAFGTEWP